VGGEKTLISPKQLLKRAALAPLKLEPVRSRVAFWLNQEHYPELDIRVPLSHGLVCPIYSPEYWCSFSEIFVNGEYGPAFEMIPVPNRWIDLGCHAGFFSLYVEWRRRQAGLGAPPECVLLDADARLKKAVEQLAAVNMVPFRFLHGGIGGRQPTMEFTERAFMASSASDVDRNGGIRMVIPTVGASKLEDTLQGPCDLIKVDIEGSEYDLLENYGSLLSQTKHLLLEWHSWHRGGGGKAQLIEMAKAHGLEFKAEVRAAHEVAKGKMCGVLLFENSRKLKAQTV
jgi:FkbM family methyltransferase